MKEFLKTAVYSALAFGLIMGFFYSLAAGVYFGAISGIASGSVFGIIIAAFAQFQRHKFRKLKSEIVGNLEVILDDGANHFKGKEAVGGYLFLTPEKLIFKSHNFNIQNHQTIIRLSQIDKVKAVQTLGIVPNGLLIILKDGSEERFVVYNRRNWINKITQAISL